MIFKSLINVNYSDKQFIDSNISFKKGNWNYELSYNIKIINE